MSIPQMCIDEAQKAAKERERFAKAQKASLSTKQGRVKALAAFRARQKARAKIEPVNNGRLYAGEPMYFYCQHCGDVSDTKGESYTDKVNHTCRQCQALQDEGWLP